ncbi:MAG: class I SAM-dependent methyltransferase [Geobacteraceae bacterium]
MRDEIKQVDIDKIYREMPLEKIPWNVETPPEAMVELVRSGSIKPCKTVDLGCGAGNQAVYLAGMGFSVTGVDSSAEAIRLAGENAAKKKVSCRFVVADVLGDLREIPDTFDFAYDWELLHHIYPEQRETYIANVHRLLNQGGKYLSVCFSEHDTQFGGVGKYRETALGTVLYFSSEDELQILFERHFSILELKTIKINGKFVNHLANYVFMERK